MVFDKDVKKFVLGLKVFPIQIHNEIIEEKGSLSGDVFYDNIEVYSTNSFVPEIRKGRQKINNILWEASYGSWESDIIDEKICNEDFYGPEVADSFTNLSDFLKEEMVTGGGTFHIVKIPSPLFMEEGLPPYINQKEYIERGEWRWFKDYTKKPKVYIARP